jgi:hypothetical protein
MREIGLHSLKSFGTVLDAYNTVAQENLFFKKV